VNARVADNKFRVSLATQPGLTYTLEGAENPAGPWSSLVSIRPLETSLDFEDPAPSTNRFYRVQVK
jgi:hypothetical protein